MSRDSHFEQQPLRCMANYYDHDRPMPHAWKTITPFEDPKERYIPDRMANYADDRAGQGRAGFREPRRYKHQRMRQHSGQVGLQTEDAPKAIFDQTSAPMDNHAIETLTDPSDTSVNDIRQEVSEYASRSSLETQLHDESNDAWTLNKKLKAINDSFQAHTISSRFYGWRMGVLLGSCTSTLVLICNIAMVVVGAKTQSGYDQNGVVTLSTGNEETISRWNTICHVFINVLSTILLSASNYTMQVLNSPTRYELDMAHSSGKWLDIGLVSVHNLRIISRKRAALCLILAVSSLPLHLFYNAAIFKIISMSTYDVLVIEATDPMLNKSDPTIVRLENSLWADLYDKASITKYSDLYLTFDQISYRTQQNLTEMAFPITDYFPLNVSSETFTRLPKPSNGWSPFDQWRSVTLDLNLTRQPPSAAMPDNIHIVEGWTRKSDVQSRIQISLPFMIVVVTFNMFKLAIMIGILLMDSSEYLVTMGDAAASYLEQPEASSAGKSTMDFDNMTPSLKDHQLVVSSPIPWRPRRRRYCSSIGYDKIWSAIIAGALLVFVVVFFPTRVIDLGTGMWHWGSASSGTLSFGAKGAATKTTILNAWLSNMPQVLLSLCYINLNALCTAMASTAEWNNLAVTRKGLRVTNPRGDQRSTYFLQLPYKWATPLMVTSGGLHWLLSQTFFLSRVDYYGPGGKFDRWTSTCGISFSGLVTFSVVCLILVIAIRWIGRRPMMSNLPLAENCSLMISAACHPSPSEVDPHLKKVKWGVIPGTGQCSLSSKHVEAPEVGKVYA